jgi:hypothetical protein
MATCPNCGREDLREYCSGCGQKAGDHRLPFGKLLGETMSKAFALDSRIGRTIIPFLLRPGFLTNEYNAGRRLRYSSPWRLYLLASFVFFVAVSLSPGNPLELNVQAGHKSANVSVTVEPLEESELTDQQRAELRHLDKAFGPLGTRMREKIEALNSTQRAELSLRVGEVFVDTWPKAMFLLLPFFALLLKLFFPGRERFYSEHLILALHLHAFGFTLLLLPIATDSELAGFIALGLIGLYIALALRQVYAQGWGRTLAKMLGLGVCYGILLALTMAGVAFFSVLKA